MSLLDRLSNHVMGRSETPAQPVAQEQPVRSRIRPVGARPVQAPPPSAEERTNRLLPNSWLGDIVSAGDNEPERVRKGMGGYIHVSSLIGFCARQHVILRSHTDQPLMRNVTGGHRVMWRLGRAAEEHVRDSVLKVRKRDVMGEWSCACGHTKHRGHHPDRVCPKCEKRLNRYGEMTLFDNEAKIVGNPDLLIREDGTIIPIEIKSMNKKEWDALTGPKGDHVFQVVAYARMLKALHYPSRRFAVIVYVAKDFVFGSPYKEFHVDVENPFLVEQWERARTAAMEAHAAIEAETIPARTLCSDHNSTMAKACPCVAQCFLRD